MASQDFCGGGRVDVANRPAVQTAMSAVTLGGERYVPTPEEQQVLDECRRNALMRGAIYGVGTMLLGYPLVKRQVGAGKMTALHRGAISVAGMTGCATP